MTGLSIGSYYNPLLIGRGIEVPQKRRVFFSFHYQNDIFRANQIRNSWKFQKFNEREAFGFYDGSIWENSKRTGPDSLKNLIRDGIDNTSVTCVLAGTNTSERRWVRYEIARSLIKQNGLLNVRIHNIPNMYGVKANMGGNPLDYMGVYATRDGQIFISERDSTLVWVKYADYSLSINLPATWNPPTVNCVTALSEYAQNYDYVSDRGVSNFANWVAAAAISVNR